MNPEYKRIQNTYYFNYSDRSDVRGAAGVRQLFNFQVPSLPPLPNGESKTGIFRLLSSNIGGQSPNNNVYSTDGYYLGVNGLSLRPQVLGGNNVFGVMTAQNRFFIPNITPFAFDVNNAGPPQVIQGRQQYNVSGCELNNPYEVICGNPSGQTLSISLFNNLGVPLVATQGDLANNTFQLCFSIELIDPDDDQNF